LLKWLRELLTRKRILLDPSTGRRVRVVEEPPSWRFLIAFTINLLLIALLTSAQILWLIIYREWNDSIFQGLIAVLCIMLGALWGRKA